MNSEKLRQLMTAAQLDPESAWDRRAFAKALGVDRKTVRRWLAGSNMNEGNRKLLRDYKPREQVARAAVEAFWRGEVAACVECLAPLLEQNTSETCSRLDKLATVFKQALDAVATVFKNGLDALASGMQSLGAGGQGLHAKADAMESEVQQLQAKADELGNGVQRIEAGVQQLQA